MTHDPDGIGPSPGRIRNWLFSRVSGQSLAFFRIGFGLCCLHLLFTYFDGAMIEQLSVPGFRFKFLGFEWVEPWPGEGLHYHVWALRALALFITVGFLYRINMFLFFLGYTYLFLLDQGIYQNHFYLLSLLSLLMIFMPANRCWAVDTRWFGRSDLIPAWPVHVLRLQLAIVYFYAGLAKLNMDWLNGEPIRCFSGTSAWASIVGQEWVIYSFIWIGLVFDLLVAPLLYWRRTRMIAYDISLIFHVMNSQIWRIDIFPYFMIIATLIFFEPDWPSRLRWWPQRTLQWVEVPPSRLRQNALMAFLALYFVVQLLLPFRHFAYPGNALWTDEGRAFAWRMMLTRKRSIATFRATDPATGETWVVKPVDFQTASNTTMNAWGSPDRVLQFAHYAKSVLEEQRKGPVEIRAEVYCSLHRRKPQLLVDPKVDLGTVERSLRPASWILPLSEPFPASDAERNANLQVWLQLGGHERMW